MITNITDVRTSEPNKKVLVDFDIDINIPGGARRTPVEIENIIHELRREEELANQRIKDYFDVVRDELLRQF